MGEILAWLGDYWWLVFPVGGAAFGVIGTVTGLFERQAEQEHRRKLETIEAKARAKAIAAGSDVSPEAIERSDSAGRTQRLERLMETHDEVTRRWLDYELDVAKLIAFPTMSDGREELTAAFLRAKKVADGLRPASAEERIDAETLAEYRDAVHDFEVAFDIAEQNARRVRDTGFTDAERRRLERAQQLLRTAVDTSATAAERQVAYKRVREELDGLIALSDGAIEVLEKKVAPEIEG
ncbi:hypothetical protein [Microbacterium sediminis]|uniref:Uncharacterized protein n=1 Tax=Microbacterium sediminis TaxID=904291 RepID=A0A1B9NIC3_9MICO|nr:hypothetical protein [Microbacterium sediminis]OCG76362.1 hypothetical protein A7J15_12185 [Microbacterium sediminis]QBR73092.1 hypothetical protein E3O41_00635 [Microbacterium sediminis]